MLNKDNKIIKKIILGIPYIMPVRLQLAALQYQETQTGEATNDNAMRSNY